MLTLRTIFKTFDFVDDNDDKNWSGNKRRDCWVFMEKHIKNHKSLINGYLKKVNNREISLNYVDENTIDLALITLKILNPSKVGDNISLLSILDVFSSSAKLRNLIFENRVMLNDKELVSINNNNKSKMALKRKSHLLEVIKTFPLHITQLNPYKLLYVIYKMYNTKKGFNLWLKNWLGLKWVISYEHLLVLINKENWKIEHLPPIKIKKYKRKRLLEKKKLSTELLLSYLNDWKTKKEIMKQLESNNYDTDGLSKNVGKMLHRLCKKKTLIKTGAKRNYSYILNFKKIK